MPALAAGIHVLAIPEAKTWMAGTSPAMTIVKKIAGPNTPGRRMTQLLTLPLTATQRASGYKNNLP